MSNEQEYVVITVPFQPKAKVQRKAVFAAPVVAKTISCLINCPYYLGLNRLHSYKQYSEEEIECFRKQFDFVRYDGVYFDSEVLDKLQMIIDDQIANGDVTVEKCRVLKCACGKVEIIADAVQSLHTFDWIVKTENGYQCAHCKSELLDTWEESLILHLHAKAIQTMPVRVYPEFYDSEMNHFRTALSDARILISKQRDTGAQCVVNGRTFNIDTDYVWQNLYCLYPQKNIITILSNRHRYAVFIMNYLAHTVHKKQACFVVLPMLDLNKTVLDQLSTLSDEKTQKLFFLFAQKWSIKTVQVPESIAKYLSKSFEKNAALYEAVVRPIEEFHDLDEEKQWAILKKSLFNRTNMQLVIKQGSQKKSL